MGIVSNEKGQGLAEYSLILALVAIVSVVILALLGPTIGNVFSEIIVPLDLFRAPVEEADEDEVVVTAPPGTVEMSSPLGGHYEEGSMTFSWQPRPESEAVSQYRVVIFKHAGTGGFDPFLTLSAGCCSRTITLNQGMYKWTVQAQNSMGWGPVSGQSDTIHVEDD